MAKTNGEKIDELLQSSATFDAMLAKVWTEIDSLKAKNGKTDDLVTELRIQLAVLEERSAEMKKSLEEASRRRWSLVPSLVSAIAGGLIALGIQFAMKKLFP
jgi:uncharacterized coiled-coil DUF342 family protein